MAGGTKAYRYAIRDDLGRTILERYWVPERLSEVRAERAGNTVTLYAAAQVLEQVEVDPAMGPLSLLRWNAESDTPAKPVTHRVPVVDVPF